MKRRSSAQALCRVVMSVVGSLSLRSVTSFVRVGTDGDGSSIPLRCYRILPALALTVCLRVCMCIGLGVCFQPYPFVCAQHFDGWFRMLRGYPIGLPRGNDGRYRGKRPRSSPLGDQGQYGESSPRSLLLLKGC